MPFRFVPSDCGGRGAERRNLVNQEKGFYRTRRPAACGARPPNASVTSVLSVVKNDPSTRGEFRVGRAGVCFTTEDTEVTEIARR